MLEKKKRYILNSLYNHVTCFQKKKNPDNLNTHTPKPGIICFWWLKHIISLLYSVLSWISFSFLSGLFSKALTLPVRVHVLSFSQQQIFAGGCNIWNSLRQYSFPSTTRQTYSMWFNWYLTIVFWLSLHTSKCICPTISWFNVGRITLQEESAQGQSC